MVQNVQISPQANPAAFSRLSTEGQQLQTTDTADTPTTTSTGSDDSGVIVDVSKEFKGSNGRFDDSLRFNGAQGRGFAFGKVKQAERAAAEEPSTAPTDNDTGSVTETDDDQVTAAAVEDTGTEEVQADDDTTAVTPVSSEYSDAVAALELLTADTDEVTEVDLLV